MTTDYQLISLIATGIAIAGVAVGYLDLKRRQRRADGEAEKVLRQAQEKAENVLRQAKDRALDILEKYRLDTENRNEKLEIRLDKVEEKEMQDFKKAVVNVASELQGEAATVVGQKIDEEFAKARLEIQGYKAQKLKEIDAKATEIIKDVTRKALGKALDTAKHTALIAAALEEAKLAHVL